MITKFNGTINEKNLEWFTLNKTKFKELGWT
jgi:hypothetical protein